MLVLTRQSGQEILIGKDVRLKIIRIRKNQVRVGIEAPEEVVVLRRELLNQAHQGDDASRFHVHSEAGM